MKRNLRVTFFYKPQHAYNTVFKVRTHLWFESSQETQFDRVIQKLLAITVSSRLHNFYVGVDKLL